MLSQHLVEPNLTNTMEMANALPSIIGTTPSLHALSMKMKPGLTKQWNWLMLYLALLEPIPQLSCSQQD